LGKLFCLATVVFCSPLISAQTAISKENSPIISDREQRGLRGPVKSCVDERTYPGATDPEGNRSRSFSSAQTSEFDTGGRILAMRIRNADGSEWVTRYSYDTAGRLLKTDAGLEGKPPKQTLCSYDQQGRLQQISSADKPDDPIVFRYDEQGRKTKIQTSRPADYQPNVASAGSPFEAADRPPNFPDGGTTTTIYDENDRAVEVQVHNGRGELVTRAVRTYNAQGHIAEEKQILDDPVMLFPPEHRAKMAQEAGVSEDEVKQGLRAQLTKLMAGQSGPYSVSYSYDANGRITHTDRQIFTNQDQIDTTYNEHGDVESEITRNTRLPGETDPTAPAPGPGPYSEVRYTYQYDQHGNWIEKIVAYRSGPDGAFQPSTTSTRKLTYY
jgi:hypothetical protein